nr:MAG TPA: Ead/Ea22-like protein [Caudoviricetes sp.]
MNINKQALTVEAISQAFAGTNFGRDDLKNILAETVIDAAAGWRCGHTATTICTQLGLLTPKGKASALGLRFISEHVQRETKRLKDELEAAEKRIAELEAREVVLPQRYSMLHRVDFNEPYHTEMVYKQHQVLEALHDAGVNVAAAGKGE